MNFLYYKNLFYDFSFYSFYIKILQYFCLIISIFYISFVFYFKLKFNFWSKQPVFHFHNLWYWITPPKIIYPNGNFPINKYYTPYDVKTMKFNDIDDTIKNKFFNLIQTNYLISNHSNYNPPNKRIDAYFHGHNNNCFISFIERNKNLIEYSKEKNTMNNINSSSIICALTSRPIDIYLCYGEKHFQMNYVDFLCTHNKERKKGNAPKVIYTYAIDSQKYKPNTSLFLFKREGQLTAIVPLITYSSYMYNLKYWKKKELYHPFIVVEINEENFQLIRNCLSHNNLNKKFNVVGISNISNIIELLKNNCIYIYALTIPNSNKIFGLYFFKNNDVYFINKNSLKNNSITNDNDNDNENDNDNDNEKKQNYITKSYMIDCFGSILFNNVFDEERNSYSNIEKQNTTLNNNNIFTNEEINTLFEYGFYNSCFSLKNDKKYSYINIENISDNYLFLKNIILYKDLIDKSPTAYFFYNYASKPYLSKETFLLF